jgi:hypothetical protein
VKAQNVWTTLFFKVLNKAGNQPQAKKHKIQVNSWTINWKENEQQQKKMSKSFDKKIGTKQHIVFSQHFFHQLIKKVGHGIDKAKLLSFNIEF